MALLTPETTRWVAAATALMFVFASVSFVVPVSGSVSPVAFDDTVKTGGTSVDVRTAEVDGFEVPLAQAHFSRYRYIIGYYDVRTAAADVSTPESARQFGDPLAVFVTDYATVSPDLDADGCEEVYVHNCARGVDGGDPDLLLSRLEADRYRWTDVFAREVNADRLDVRAGRSVAALDRLGTGRYGVAVSGYAAPLAFYELGDDGEVTDMAEAVGLEVDGGCRSLLAVPYRSREGDLFAGVEGGPNRLFSNRDGHYDRTDGGPALSDPSGDTRGAAVVDEGGTITADFRAGVRGFWKSLGFEVEQEGSRFWGIRTP